MTPNYSNLEILRFLLYLDLYIQQAFSTNIWIFGNYFNSWIELWAEYMNVPFSVQALWDISVKSAYEFPFDELNCWQIFQKPTTLCFAS